MGAGLILLMMVTLPLMFKYALFSSAYPSADDLRRVVGLSSCHHQEVVEHLLSGRPLEQRDVREIYRRCVFPSADAAIQAPVLSGEAAAAFAAQRVILEGEQR